MTGIKLDWRDKEFGHGPGCMLEAAKDELGSEEQVRLMRQSKLHT